MGRFIVWLILAVSCYLLYKLAEPYGTVWAYWAGYGSLFILLATEAVLRGLKDGLYGDPEAPEAPPPPAASPWAAPGVKCDICHDTGVVPFKGLLVTCECQNEPR